MTITLNKTNRNYKKSQNGRSMVEMLGVLAIVGVLSVGGVYGYGVAMKKHKANELLHQASMLAATISAQAMTNDGKLPETITSFGNSNYGTFSTSATDALNGKGFSITIENVDSAVCDQLKKGGMVQGVDCKEGTSEGKMNAEITYYKNLATNDEEGKNSPTGNGSCKSGIVKLYNCETKTTTDCCPDNETCEQPICSCDEENLCPGNQVCTNGSCGCPRAEDYNATIGTDGLTCCGDLRLAWDEEEESYAKLNINACGCPIDDLELGTQGTLVDGICCLNGKAWDDNYDTYSINSAFCL